MPRGVRARSTLAWPRTKREQEGRRWKKGAERVHRGWRVGHCCGYRYIWTHWCVSRGPHSDVARALRAAGATDFFLGQLGERWWRVRMRHQLSPCIIMLAPDECNSPRNVASLKGRLITVRVFFPAVNQSLRRILVAFMWYNLHLTSGFSFFSFDRCFIAWEGYVSRAI